MTDRRNFLKTALLPAGAFCLASAIPAGAQAFGGTSARRYDAGQRQDAGDQAGAESSPLSQKLKTITRATPWTLVQQIKVQFKTFHCQGMARIGKDFWVSSVEISTPFDRNKGKGHLFRIDEQGNQLADIPIGEGSIYHPSGIDFDGTFIWIAAAEYRPDSQAIIYSASNLSNGPHTLKIVVVGTHSSGSTDNFVSIDAINVPVAGSTGTVTYPKVPQEPGTAITLNGRDSHIIVANYKLGTNQMQYSTSEIMTNATIGGRDIAVLYGDAGSDGETVLNYSAQPTVVSSGGTVKTTWDAASGDLRLNYSHNGLLRIAVKGPGAGD